MITSPIPENTDTVEWGPLQPPPPYTAPDATTASPNQALTYSSELLNTSSTSFPTTTAWPNSTSTASLSATTKSEQISSPCTLGKKGGCTWNTDTSKTELPGYSPTKSEDEPATSTATCDITLAWDDPGTSWIIVPNTGTITLTITANISTSFSKKPEFTPPVYCWPPDPDAPGAGAPFLTSQTVPEEETSSQAAFPISTSGVGWAPGGPTTIVITSKNPVTVFTVETPPPFPGGVKTDKIPVTPGVENTDTVEWGPLQPPPTFIAATTPMNQVLPTSNGIPKPTTAVVGGVPVVVGPSVIIVGTKTVGGGVSSTKITENGQTFTVNPTQVIGPGVVIPRPPSNGAIFIPAPTKTTIAGILVQLGPSAAIIDGTTFSIGPGAQEQTAVIDGQTISFGPGGLGFAQTTVAPQALPTNIVILGGEVFSAVGPSQVVIDGSTFTYGPGSAAQTDVFNGETITIGPSGINFGSSVLGGPGNPSGTQFGLAGGISVTEMGESFAIISGTTFIVGPGATSTAAVINGKSVIAGPGGLTLGGTVLSYPFNQGTQGITAGGITFSQIGSTLINIGGTTYTVGADAKTTTNVYNGQTISLGPGGVGFKTTTVSPTSEPLPTGTGKGKKNAGSSLGSYHGVLGICIAIGAWNNLLY